MPLAMSYLTKQQVCGHNFFSCDLDYDIWNMYLTIFYYGSDFKSKRSFDFSGLTVKEKD